MEKSASIEFIKGSSEASLYTITFGDSGMSEFQKFLTKFKDNSRLQRDYQLILIALSKILSNGVKERYFRPEGKFSDRVCAMPIDSCKLRLYCLRISDKILILGNGGLKNTKSYEEDVELNGYVMDLQKFDALLKTEQSNGNIEITETIINGIEDKEFII